MRLRIAELRDAVARQRDLLLPGLASLMLRLAGLASSLLLGVLLARVLGPAEYGIYGLVIAIAAVTMNLALLGTPQLAVREMAVRAAQADAAGVRTLARSFLIATTLASLVVGAITVVAVMLLIGARPHALTYALIGTGLSALLTATSLIAAMLRGVGAMFKGQFMDIAWRPFAALVVCALAFAIGYPLHAESALAIQLIVALIAAGVSLAWIRRAIGGVPIAWPGDWRWLRAALPLAMVDVLRQLDGTYGLILLGLVGTAEELGIYRVALASVVLAGMPVTILHVVLAPSVSRMHHFGEHDRLQRLLKRASAAMVAANLPMLLLLIVAGRPLVTLIFGPAYTEAAIPLAILCAAQLVYGFFGMAPVLLAMAGSERRLTLIYLLSVGVGILASIPLTMRFGAIGAASAQLISSALIAFWTASHARRRLGLGTTFLTAAAPPPAG